MPQKPGSVEDPTNPLNALSKATGIEDDPGGRWSDNPLINKITNFLIGERSVPTGPADVAVAGLAAMGGLKGAQAGWKALTREGPEAGLLIKDKFGLKDPTTTGRREFMYRLGGGPRKAGAAYSDQILNSMPSEITSAKQLADLKKSVNLASRILNKHELAPGKLASRLYPEDVSPNVSVNIPYEGPDPGYKRYIGSDEANILSRKASQLRAARRLVKEHGSPEGVQKAILKAKGEIAEASKKSPRLPKANELERLLKDPDLMADSEGNAPIVQVLKERYGTPNKISKVIDSRNKELEGIFTPQVERGFEPAAHRMRSASWSENPIDTLDQLANEWQFAKDEVGGYPNSGIDLTKPANELQDLVGDMTYNVIGKNIARTYKPLNPTEIAAGAADEGSALVNRILKRFGINK